MSPLNLFLKVYNFLTKIIYKVWEFIRVQYDSCPLSYRSNRDQAPKKDTQRKKPHEKGLSSVEGISMFMMWICIESLVIILRFISIRVTILQVITLHDHISTGPLFCKDPYSCLPRENGIIFIHVSFGKKNIFLPQKRFPHLDWCLYLQCYDA